MTNEELIAQLSKLPPHLPVFASDREDIGGEIVGVRIEKDGCTDMRTWQKCDCIILEQD